MGERGPVPVPDNVRALRGMEGLKLPDGRTAKQIVMAPKAPARPAGMGKIAVATWKRLVPELERAGVLSQVDRDVLVAYCTAYQHMVEADAQVRREGKTTPGRDGGHSVRNPAWIVYKDATHMVSVLSSLLYLNPVTRLRMPVAAGAAGIEHGVEDGDDFD